MFIEHTASSYLFAVTLFPIGYVFTLCVGCHCERSVATNYTPS